MKSIESLMQKAMEMKKNGLSEKEIADELHLSSETITWLLTRGVEEDSIPADAKIGWRSIGVFGDRIQNISMLMMDIIEEELCLMEDDVDTILGIDVNGIPFASFISATMGKEVAIFRPPLREDVKGTLSSNYADIRGKKVVIVDDVLGTGQTMKNAVSTIKENGGNPILLVVLVNKTPHNEILGVPLRALIRARVLR